MAFPKTRSHIIALFVDNGMTEGQANNLSRDCCNMKNTDSIFGHGPGEPDKKVVKAAIAQREAELTYLRLIDLK